MLACVYPGLFLHTHTYTQFALSYPFLIISHPSPPALHLPPHPPFLSPPESRRVMWTAREEGWEKEERSVKEERDVVGVIAESSYSLVKVCAFPMSEWVVKFAQSSEQVSFRVCVWGAWLCVSVCQSVYRRVRLTFCLAPIRVSSNYNQYNKQILYFASTSASRSSFLCCLYILYPLSFMSSVSKNVSHLTDFRQGLRLQAVML